MNQNYICAFLCLSENSEASLANHYQIIICQFQASEWRINGNCNSRSSNGKCICKINYEEKIAKDVLGDTMAILIAHGHPCPSCPN